MINLCYLALRAVKYILLHVASYRFHVPGKKIILAIGLRKQNGLFDQLVT
jgi:hypothetical protein